MKALFIGGTGTISADVSALAVRSGIDLYLLNRGNRGALVPRGATVIQGDIRNPDEVKRALDGQRFDAVVNWIAYKPEDIERDLELFRGRTSQYVFISSASAYQKPPLHYLVTESTPLRNTFYQYPQDKIACEELLVKEYRESAFPMTIVRPSYTYHRSIPFPFNSKKHPWTLVERLRSGKRIIVPGDGTSLWTMTHAADFAAGFVGLLGKESALGHAFHITSDEVLTWDRILLAISKAAGLLPEEVESRIVHVSSDFIGAFSPDHYGGLMGDKSHSLVFDNGKIKRFVPSFRAEIPFAAGIHDSIRWYDEHPELKTTDEEFDRLYERILAAYDAGIAMAGKA